MCDAILFRRDASPVPIGSTVKIAFFSPEWPYGQNGIISYVRNIGQSLHGLGHEVLILTPHARGRLGYERVVPVPDRRGRRIVNRLVAKTARVLGREPDGWRAQAGDIADQVSDLVSGSGIDVLEIEETFGWAGLIADAVDIPVVVRLHGPYFINGVYEEPAPGRLDPRRLKREGEGIRRAAAVTAPSRQVLEATRAFYGLTREACVIPNPAPMDDSGTCWSATQREPDTILFVGRTDGRKGGDLVLRVFGKLAGARPNLRLHFVGPDRGFVDARPGTSVRDYVTEKYGPDVGDRVIYHGPLQPAEIAALRLKCHVTVAFSRYENFPLACVEALASGCPLVATRVGGIPEIVIDGETGLLADPDDLDDMADKVAGLLDDESLCVRLGTGGRARCREELHPRKVAMRTLDVYRRAVAVPR